MFSGGAGPRDWAKPNHKGPAPILLCNMRICEANPYCRSNKRVLQAKPCFACKTRNCRGNSCICKQMQGPAQGLLCNPMFASQTLGLLRNPAGGRPAACTYELVALGSSRTKGPLRGPAALLGQPYKGAHKEGLRPSWGSPYSASAPGNRVSREGAMRWRTRSPIRAGLRPAMRRRI